MASVTGLGETNPADNVVTIPITSATGPTSDLAVTQAALSPAPGAVTFEVVVTNNGPNDAAQVTLTDVLPPGATLASIVPQGGTCGGTRRIACRLDLLAAGATWRITVALVDTRPAAVEHLVAVGSVFADPVLANNASQAAGVFSGPQSTDTDSDGMPDAWEALMGLSVTTADANGDADGDGISNIDEIEPAPTLVASTIASSPRA